MDDEKLKSSKKKPPGVSTRALTGVKVLEYAHFVAAPYCAKLLSDLGAEVIKVEEPGVGDEARRWGPFRDDIPHPERSGLFLYLNTNKKSVTLDPESCTGREILRELVRTADVLIEDNAQERMKALGLDYQSLKAINHRLVMTSITPFGQTGPYSDCKAYYLNTYQSCMLGYLTPVGSSRLERSPLKIGGLVGEYACGLSAAVATLGALYSQRLCGKGQHIDISKQESLLGFGRVNAAYFANEGKEHPRVFRLMGKGGMMPCSNGYVCAHVPEDHQWSALVELMGSPEWATTEKFKTPLGRMMYLEEIIPSIKAWTRERSKEELYHAAQGRGCTITPVATADTIVNSEHSKARGLFSEIDHPEAGRFKYPTSPFIFSGMPVHIERPAPLLGEHNEEIYIRRLGYTREDLVQMTRAGII